MIRTLRGLEKPGQIRTRLVAAGVLALAFLLGLHASPRWLGLLVAVAGGIVLLILPVLGVPALVLAALVVPLEVGTGTAVKLNPATLLIPVVLAVWVLSMLRRREIRLASSPANLPLFLFLVANLISLLVGRAMWDPMVPLQGNFILVQLAQWGILALSAGAFWLTANLVKEERWLWRVTAVFLAAGGALAILQELPPTGDLASRLATVSLNRAPFWALLAAVAGGQLLFNRELAFAWRVFLAAVLAACAAYGFVVQREAVSNWVGLTAVLGMLLWLRFRRLRWLLVIIVVVLILIGVLIPGMYRFAGGDEEWGTSGGSRLALVQRVIEVTLRNPVTGLGPAAYRPYANMKPLLYRAAYWINPQVNSHNNYVDLFAHGGVVGLTLFAWFTIAIAKTGLRLRRRGGTGFALGYVNGMLAMGVGALVLMVLADWILPFVYNIGFPGFQASMLVWLFLGGLVALDNIRGEPARNGEGENQEMETK